MEEIEVLHNSFVAQLVDIATKSYNDFTRGFELLNNSVIESESLFQKVIRNNDYYLNSLLFYNHKFFGLNRSTEYLYIGQLLSLQIKACHNLIVINNNQNNIEESDNYLSKQQGYKEDLYFYYLLAKDDVKVGPILMMFLKDAKVDDEIKDKASKRYQEYIANHQ